MKLETRSPPQKSTNFSRQLLLPQDLLAIGLRMQAGNLSAPVNYNVHYDEGRAPTLANSTVPDTILQNSAAGWTLDVGDLDVGDTLQMTSFTGVAWLTAIRQPDSAYGSYPTHFVCRFTGTPRTSTATSS